MLFVLNFLRKNGLVSETWQLTDDPVQPANYQPPELVEKPEKAKKAMKAMKKSVKKKPSKK